MSSILPCATCGTTLRIADHRLRKSTTGRFYCSHVCRAANPAYRASKSAAQTLRYASGGGFTPEARAKMSVSASKRKPTWRPRIEGLVEKALVSYGVPFTPQAVLRSPGDYLEGGFGIRPDFLVRIGEVLVAVELNGTYFHSDSRRWDREHLTKTQRRNLVRYERKLRLYRHLGIQVRELWELENDRFLEILVFPLIAEVCCLRHHGVEELEDLLLRG